MATTKQDVYDEALLICRERKVLTTENIEARRLLDGVWDRGAIDYCLKQGLWKFALRSVQLIPESGITPTFGNQFAYAQPSDFIRTAALSPDEYFYHSVFDVEPEGGFWYVDYDIVYLKYVSNDAAYGGGLNNWTVDFQKYVSAYLAYNVCGSISGISEDKIKMVRDIMMDYHTDARNKDAMESPTKFRQSGRLTSSRVRGSSTYSRIRFP